MEIQRDSDRNRSYQFEVIPPVQQVDINEYLRWKFEFECSSLTSRIRLILGIVAFFSFHEKLHANLNISDRASNSSSRSMSSAWLIPSLETHSLSRKNKTKLCWGDRDFDARFWLSIGLAWVWQAEPIGCSQVDWVHHHCFWHITPGVTKESGGWKSISHLKQTEVI